MIGSCEGSFPSFRIWEVPQGVGAEEDQGLQLARFEGGSDLLGALAHRCFREAGAGIRQTADLAQAAGVGQLRTLKQATAFRAGEIERIGYVKEGAVGILALAPDSLAPNDHDAFPSAQHLGDRCRFPLRTFCGVCPNHAGGGRFLSWPISE